MNIAVFASRQGSDLQAIINGCRSGQIQAKVSVVISNNGNSMALERARIEGIDAYHISSKVLGDGIDLDEAILEILSSHNIDLIFLAGYLKLVGKKVLRNYKNRIFNIHPSLLPKYGGKGMYDANVHEAVINAKEKVTGITIHRVDEEYDTGEIVAQTKVIVYEDDTPITLAQRVLETEHLFIVDVLIDIFKEINKMH